MQFLCAAEKIWILLQKALLYVILLSSEWFAISQDVQTALPSIFLNVKVKNNS